MKRIALSVLIAVACCHSAASQVRLPAYDSRINPLLLDSWSGPKVYNNDRWSASWITLPDGIDGIFVWKGRSEKLHPGENRLSL